MATLSDFGEFGLIDRLAQRLEQREGVITGIGDDAAVLKALTTPMVTTDALIENVHFRRDWMSAFQIGRKAMAVNISDLAAMGANPVAAFIALGVPKDTSPDWIFEFYDGLESCCRDFGGTLAGGDTVAAPQVVVSLTLIGEAMPEAQGQPLLRAGAQTGDLLVVSGTIGDSAAGLHLYLNPWLKESLESAHHRFLLERHANPTPRLELMHSLLTHERASIHACLDLSDGLAGDARHMARRSEKKLVIDAEKLPLSASMREFANSEADALNWALSGGEDYELLLAIEPAAFEEFHRVAQHMGTTLTAIGEVKDGEGVEICLRGAVWQGAGAWRHF